MTDCLGFLLVVDDEEMNRDMLGRRLEVEGYSVRCAANGADALQLIAEQPFDAVLLDVMMPVQNGFEVLREIRKSHSSLELPVLMVTAKNQNEDVVNAFEIGANDYLTKPINFPVALARINSHVSSRRLSSRLRESESRYSLSAQGANDGLWDWNLSTDEIHYSLRWKTMLGYGAECIGQTPDEWFGRIHPEDLSHVRQALDDHRAGRTEQFESEHRMLRHDRSYCWVMSRGVAIRDAAGREVRMAGSQTDITRGKAADPLTGLANRVLFMDHLDAAAKAGRDINHPLYAVLFIDLDRFKVINDSLGHLAGDELLATVARRLESCLRASDVVSRLAHRCTIARFGGDEFVVLLRGLLTPTCACQVADRILGVLAEPMTLRGHDVSISASIGIAVGNQGQDSAEDLVRDADTAMYQAKTAGKSRWCLFDQPMRTKAVDRLALENDLKKGLERGQFQVFYQPIVSLPSGSVEGFEALLRWKHPTRGMVPPIEFIPIAEEIGYIVELGTWVLEQACTQMRSWQREYPDQALRFMSVNVAGRQFADPTLLSRITDCLARTGMSPGCLKLELTESSIMEQPALAAKTMESIRALGVRISLDDFGTGYSSLSYLRQFPIDTLKIDRSFIERLGRSDEVCEIVRTIVALAHSLGMNVTAEGIELNSQHSQLNSIDCENGQGYLYSRPVAANEIEELLKDARRESAVGAPTPFSMQAAVEQLLQI